MRALLTLCYSNPTPNLMQCAKNNTGIKTLTVVPRALRVLSNATLLGLCLALTLRFKMQNNNLGISFWRIQSSALMRNDTQTSLVCNEHVSSPLPQMWFLLKFENTIKLKILHLHYLCKFLSTLTKIFITQAKILFDFLACGFRSSWQKKIDR